MLQIEKIDVELLTSDPANVRSHDERNLEAIKGSLKRFGQQKPIVVDSEGVVIAGNGTLAAARSLGWSQIEIIQTELKGPDKTAFAIADNRTAELAKWDVPELSQTLQALKDEDPDLLNAAGFLDDEFSKILDFGIREDDHEGIADCEDEAITKTGDIWQLGNHRIMCADNSDLGQVQKLMGSKTADLIMSDPPYCVDYLGSITKARKDIKGDAVTESESYEDLIFKMLNVAHQVSNENRALYLWFSDSQAVPICNALENAGFKRWAWIVWVKNNFNMSLNPQHYRQKHEMCLYASTGLNMPKWYGPNNESTVWEYPKPSKNKLHPTMKPLEMYARCLMNSSKIGDVVYETNLGSGTTLIAAEQTDRSCYGLELSESYCDIIIERWQNATGKKAKRIKP